MSRCVDELPASALKAVVRGRGRVRVRGKVRVRVRVRVRLGSNPN